MTFTDQELRGALKEAKQNMRWHREQYRQASALSKAGARQIYREDLATVAALNFLIAARKKKGKAK